MTISEEKAELENDYLSVDFKMKNLLQGSVVNEKSFSTLVGENSVHKFPAVWIFTRKASTQYSTWNGFTTMVYSGCKHKDGADL